MTDLSPAVAALRSRWHFCLPLIFIELPSCWGLFGSSQIESSRRRVWTEACSLWISPGISGGKFKPGLLNWHTVDCTFAWPIEIECRRGSRWLCAGVKALTTWLPWQRAQESL